MIKNDHISLIIHTYLRKIETNFHRSASKGIGNSKPIGNYSSSLFPLVKAKKEGFDEVIYLDSI